MLVKAMRLAEEWQHVLLSMVFLGAACEVGAGATTGFESGTESGGFNTTGGSSSTTGEAGDSTGSGTGGDGPGYTPDPVACEPDPCVTADDCCVGSQPSLPPLCGAPGAAYPNNWSCVNQMCVHGGCSSDVDCVFPGFECVDLGSVSQCVAVCTPVTGGADLDDCDDRDDTDDDGIAHFIPGTQCIGIAAGGVSFCLQPLP